MAIARRLSKAGREGRMNQRSASQETGLIQTMRARPGGVYREQE
jgi:hypothetical protein